MNCMNFMNCLLLIKDICQMQTCFEAMGLPLSLTDGKEEQH